MKAVSAWAQCDREGPGDAAERSLASLESLVSLFCPSVPRRRAQGTQILPLSLTCHLRGLFQSSLEKALQNEEIDTPREVEDVVGLRCFALAQLDS